MIGLILLGIDVQAGLPKVEPEAVSLDPQRLATIDAIVAEGLAEKKISLY